MLQMTYDKPWFILFCWWFIFIFYKQKQHFFRKISQPWTKALALRCLALKSNERWQAWSMLHRYGLCFPGRFTVGGFHDTKPVDLCLRRIGDGKLRLKGNQGNQAGGRFCRGFSRPCIGCYMRLLVIYTYTYEYGHDVFHRPHPVFSSILYVHVSEMLCTFQRCCARVRDVVHVSEMLCTCQRCCARFIDVVHVSEMLCTFHKPPNNLRVQLHWGDQTRSPDIYIYIQYIYIQYIYIYIYYIYIYIYTIYIYIHNIYIYIYIQ